MTIYDLLNSIWSSSLREDRFIDPFPYAFTASNRSKLSSDLDLKAFDLLQRIYSVTIIYPIDRRNDKSAKEYRILNGSLLSPLSKEDLNTLTSLDSSKMPEVLLAHVSDVVWLSNHDPNAAREAIRHYYNLYLFTFDADAWTSCVVYISRAVELSAKLGDKETKEQYLQKIYGDVIRLDGSDELFLSSTLIEILRDQKYSCDYQKLLSIADKLIVSTNNNPNNNPHAKEASYTVKAEIYKALRDKQREDQTYIDYADALMAEAEAFIPVSIGKDADGNIWFYAEGNIQKAIALYSQHGADDKATQAQFRLREVQKEGVKHLQTHTFKYDVSSYYSQFLADYGSHDVHQLILDLATGVGFQIISKVKDEVLKSGSVVANLFSTQILGHDGQIICTIPALNPNDEDNLLQHMYYRAREDERITGEIIVMWFFRLLQERGIRESDLDSVFKDNPMMPEGQGHMIQDGVYKGITGHMYEALDTLAPKMENVIRELAEKCGDLNLYFDPQTGTQQSRVLGEVFKGEHLNECVDENILFTFNGLLQQKAGSNIRNTIGHGLDKEQDCWTGDCLYFVVMVLKFFAMYTAEYNEAIYKSIEKQKEKKSTVQSSDGNEK